MFYDLKDKKPQNSGENWVAPNATIIGDVTLEINTIKVPFSPLISFNETTLFSVDFNSKGKAFLLKSHIGV